MAKELAKKIGYTYIDTGAMYRAITHYCITNSIIVNRTVDEARLDNEIKDISLSFKNNSKTDTPEIYLNGVNVEGSIRLMEVSNLVSIVSAVSSVREALVNMQRAIGKDGAVVMDGRDIGTTVFPNAELKIFLTASAEIRATRRYNELTNKGVEVNYNDILANVLERDHLDQTREISPLKKGDDALVLDNSNMTIDEQNSWLIEQFNIASQK